MSDLFAVPFVNTIANLHLITGEDIIGVVTTNDTGTRYLVRKPVVPTIMATEQGFRVQLLPLRPYLPGIDQIELPVERVIYAVEVGEQMATMYQQFTSSIVIASPHDVSGATAQSAHIDKLLKG